ncbi:hypothetical protein HPB50_014545 [Hyalomma asiaticum]|uniref:Uncharacterized protein n=1 Tax=Hyalomma asiaticum TaxID=266040 RepID=A0ACB7TGM3_HYAAI|nr:hypothetical protein HPB50_014545 [Hyalomma asiaticum]
MSSSDNISGASSLDLSNSDSCGSVEYNSSESPFAYDPPPREPPSGPAQRISLQYVDQGCTCGECQTVLRDERIFCRDIAAIRPLLDTGEWSCITQHRLFSLLCLDEELVEVSRRQLNFYNPTYLEYIDRNRSLRYTAYRLFVWWVWSRLGRGNRQPLPGCVLRKIRNSFPSSNYEAFSWI